LVGLLVYRGRGGSSGARSLRRPSPLAGGGTTLPEPPGPAYAEPACHRDCPRLPAPLTGATRQPTGRRDLTSLRQPDTPLHASPNDDSTVRIGPELICHRQTTTISVPAGRRRLDAGTQRAAEDAISLGISYRGTIGFPVPTLLIGVDAAPDDRWQKGANVGYCR
jgi:hypothetical protein